jgi:hypothetical protein
MRRADPAVMVGKPFQPVSQMEHLQPNVFFQHDGASLRTGPHNESLNNTFPNGFRLTVSPLGPLSPNVTHCVFLRGM